MAAEIKKAADLWHAEQLRQNAAIRAELQTHKESVQTIVSDAVGTFTRDVKTTTDAFGRDYNEKIDVLTATVDNSIQTVKAEMMQQFTDKLAEDCKKLEDMITGQVQKSQ